MKSYRLVQCDAQIKALPYFPQYQQYRGRPPIHPMYIEELKRQMGEAHWDLQRGINNDWKNCVVRYPEVLAHFYSQVKVNPSNSPTVPQPFFPSPPSLPGLFGGRSSLHAAASNAGAKRKDKAQSKRNHLAQLHAHQTQARAQVQAQAQAQQQQQQQPEFDDDLRRVLAQLSKQGAAKPELQHKVNPLWGAVSAADSLAPKAQESRKRHTYDSSAGGLGTLPPQAPSVPLSFDTIFGASKNPPSQDYEGFP